MDNTTAIIELKSKVQKFCEDRDWNQFHNPKDLAIGISTEANELLDIFRFKSEDDMKVMLSDTKKDTRLRRNWLILSFLYFVLHNLII